LHLNGSLEAPLKGVLCNFLIHEQVYSLFSSFEICRLIIIYVVSLKFIPSFQLSFASWESFFSQDLAKWASNMLLYWDFVSKRLNSQFIIVV
jgi:hypothetical protein